MKQLLFLFSFFFTLMTNAQCPTVTVQSPVALTCTSSGVSFSACSNYSANVTSKWFGPSGELLSSTGTSTSYININLPGNYAVQFTDNSSNCVVTETFAIANVVGKPTFTLGTVGSFTSNCNIPFLSVQISSVLTSPMTNAPITYAIGPSSTTPVFFVNSNLVNQNFSSCSEYHIMVQDLTNNCISSVTISVECGTVVASQVNVTGPSTVCLHSSITYTASGANTYTWLSGPNTSTNNVIPLSNTPFQVSGTDNNGCITNAIIVPTVITGCADVWPGDANSDGIVDNLDVFEIGLANNIIGAARTTTSNSFTSYYSTAWGGTVSTGKNLAHADCNGDGIINSNDNTAISANFSFTHAFKPASIKYTNADLVIIPTQSVGYINEWNTAEIFLGSATNTINQIFGAAYEINIDTLFIENGSYVNFNQSFLNNLNQNITFNKLIYSNQKHYITNVRTDAINVDGNGKIGELVFKIKQGTPENTILNLSLVNGVRINSAGISGILSTGNTTLNLITNPIGINENSYLENSFTIYPNPGKDKLNLFTTNNSKITYSLSDLLGRSIVEGEFKGSIILNVSNFNDGTYIFRLSDEKTAIYKKVILSK